MLLSQSALLLLVVALIACSYVAEAALLCAGTIAALECAYSKFHPDVAQQKDDLVTDDHSRNKNSLMLSKESPNDKVEAQFTKGILRKIFRRKKKSKPEQESYEDDAADTGDADDEGQYEYESEGEADGEAAGSDGEGEYDGPLSPEYVESDTFGFDFGANLGFSVEDPASMKIYFQRKYNEQQNSQDHKSYDYFNVLEDVEKNNDDDYNEMEEMAMLATENDSDSEDYGGVSAMKNAVLSDKIGKINSEEPTIQSAEQGNFIQFPKSALQPSQGTTVSPQHNSQPGPQQGLPEANEANWVRNNPHFKVAKYADDDTDSSEDEGAETDSEQSAKEDPNSTTEKMKDEPEPPRDVPKNVEIGHAPGLGPGRNSDVWAKTNPINSWRDNGTNASRSAQHFFKSSGPKLGPPFSISFVALVAVSLL